MRFRGYRIVRTVHRGGGFILEGQGLGGGGRGGVGWGGRGGVGFGGIRVGPRGAGGGGFFLGGWGLGGGGGGDGGAPGGAFFGGGVIFTADANEGGILDLVFVVGLDVA